MGVNTLIRLPEDVRIKDVAGVVGILAGLPVVWDGHDDAKWVTIPGVETSGHKDIPEMADITISAPEGKKLVDGEQQHFCTFHYEPDRGKKGRLLYPRSNAFWIACGLRLIKFFGGSIQYSDYNEGINKQCKKPRPFNNPSDGESWDKFQAAIANVRPLTTAEIEHAKQFAAYK